jgi:hypothetical protein
MALREDLCDILGKEVLCLRRRQQLCSWQSQRGEGFAVGQEEGADEHLTAFGVRVRPAVCQLPMAFMAKCNYI